MIEHLFFMKEVHLLKMKSTFDRFDDSKNYYSTIL